MQMTLIRQVWLLLLAVLLFALIGSIATHTWSMRESLRTQLQMRNDDGAMMLALALSQQHGDEELMRLVAAAQFDTGHYRTVRLQRMDGSTIYDARASQPPELAPAWFARWLAIAAEPGVAQVSAGWTPHGSLLVESPTGWAVDALWAAWLRMTIWLGLLGIVAAAAAAFAVRAWRRPLRAAVEQATALEERRFVIAEESRVPELRRLTRSMNSLVRRLQAVFEHQAVQVEELRVQAHADAVTALATRRHFVAQLDAALRDPPLDGAGLLILRLRDLAVMNQRIGHDATDRLLAAVADHLQAYPRKVSAALCGRLNGSDFALYLPAAGMAAESAASLAAALRAALATVDQGAEFVIGGVDALQAGSGAQALALADEALAQAESAGAFAVQVISAAASAMPAIGQQQWRARIAEALQARRCELAEFAVCDRHGALLHLECPLRLKWHDADVFEPAARWLPMALRGGLGPLVDMAALQLALQRASGDGRARCVHVAWASLASPGFVGAVQGLLEAAPLTARLLSIEFGERAVDEQPRALAQACRRWRRAGARLGLEHAGASLRDLPRLHQLGVDYVKIDGAFVQGVAAQAVVREFARSLVTLLHGMQVQAIAEGVADAQDLAVLWHLGFDGATGPAVRAAS